MSNYGHYTQQYHGNKIIFPENSFLISAISFYQNNCTGIDYKTELTMDLEPDNKYDASAIAIKNNGLKIGYVPNSPNSQIKNMCHENITEPLIILNIKRINGNYGIRVIPKCFYVYDETLERQIFLSDD